MSQAKLIDSFGREHKSLRVSVTDRCNLRCRYCMPAVGMKFLPREALLSFEDLVFAVDVAASLGVDKIRITGGEPLLRQELWKLVAMVKEKTGAVDVAMTTNGLLLEQHAPHLAAAGLDRINISLDSLDPARFQEITRHGVLKEVWRGIEVASKVGLLPIRINVLMLKGFNDDEIDQWLELVKKYPIDVRFMELMPIGEGAELKRLGGYLNLTELRQRLQRERGVEPAEVEVGNGPARYWRQPGAKGRIGFITPMSNSYCNSCSRMRLTAKGELRACLAFDEQVDLGAAIRGRDRQATVAGFQRAASEKPAGHKWRSGQVTQTGMSALGG